jgi:hypothetical protein
MSSNGSAGTDHDSVMRHYFYNAPDGSVHVESALNGELWQHHVHTVPEFSLWSELVSEDSLVAMGAASCTCDLAPGQVLERNGRIWNFPQLAQKERHTRPRTR